MSAHWKAYPDAESAAQACARHVFSILEMSLAGDGDATVAFSGGKTPKLMFKHLAETRFDWSRVQLYWVDERAVPPEHEDSNFKLLEEYLIKQARIPHRNVHRVHAELPPQQAARHYEGEIRSCFELEQGELPHFDLVHLGVGPDAHIASLFPGEPLIEDREGIAAAVWVEKLGKWRITLLPGVLLAARHAAVLVSGEDKAECMRQVLRGEYAPLQFPAQIIAHHSRRATWFLNADAARLLD